MIAKSESLTIGTKRTALIKTASGSCCKARHFTLYSAGVISLKTCPKCKKELPEEATFCPYCMEKFAPENGAKTTVASNAKNAVPSKSSKKIVWLAAGIGAAVVLIGALVLFLVMGNGKRAADESTSAPAGTADPPAGQAPVALLVSRSAPARSAPQPLIV